MVVSMMWHQKTILAINPAPVSLLKFDDGNSKQSGKDEAKHLRVYSLPTSYGKLMGHPDAGIFKKDPLIPSVERIIDISPK